MNTLEARRRLLGRNVYKRTTEGNPAIAQGSLARRYPGITMQGWTEQAQYEGNQLFDKSGIVLTSEVQYIPVNVGDGEFTLSTQYNNTYRRDVFFLPGNVTDGASSSENSVALNNPKTVTSENGYVTVGLRTNTEGDMNPLDYDIMLNSGSTVLPYEPYTGGAPSPSPEYPQPITSAGKYNKDTQKWEYEITIANEQTDPDKNQTVTLTSDRPLTKWDRLEKRNGQWGWVYKSAEVVFDGSEDEVWSRYNNANGGFYVYRKDTGLKNGEFYINNFQHALGNNNMVDSSAFFRSAYYGDNTLAIRYDSADDVDSFKSFLKQNNIIFWAQTVSKTFVPLSESEQEAMNELYTFRPTTVLSNDCDCNMILTYKTKKSLEVTT